VHSRKALKIARHKFSAKQVQRKATRTRLMQTRKLRIIGRYAA